MDLLSFMKFLRGYVTVCISGSDTSAFLNLLIRQRIIIWNINKRSGDLLVNVFIRDYIKIPHIRRSFNGNASVRIVKRHGPFKFKKRLSKRPGIPIGMIVFAVIIIAVSQFIWQIEIVGNENIADYEIEQAYSSLGIYIGIPRRRVDSYALRDKLPLLVREISWCSFNVEGNKLTINVTELKESEKSENNYSNIVAKADGIITKIEVKSGNKQVKIGDVVSKGDILISGVPKLNTQNFEDSKGCVEALTFKNITVRVPKTIRVKKMGERRAERSLLDIFTFKIPLYLDAVHYENISKTKEESMKLFSKNLPIKKITREFYEISSKEKTLSVDEQINDATAALLAALKKSDVVSVQIIEVTSSEENENTVFTYNLSCIENIGEKTEIKVSG